MIENNDMKEAIDRIARTADGILLYRLLQKILCGTVAVPMQDGALQFHEGRRTLARDLMAYMAEGVQDNDRACVTFAVTRAGERTERPRGAGRRITAEHFIPGYDNADREPGAGSANGGSGAS